MKKHNIRLMVLCVAGAFIMYGTCAFAYWSFDPVTYGKFGRACLGLAIMFWMFLMIDHDK